MQPAQTDHEYADRLLTQVEAILLDMSSNQARLFSIALIEQYPESDYPKSILRDLKKVIKQNRHVRVMRSINKTELGDRLTLENGHESAYMVFHQMIQYVKAWDYVVFFLKTHRKK